MAKIHTVGILFAAVVAFGAFSACSALASETEPEFLLNGGVVSSTTEFTLTGELEMTDLKAILGTSASVDCSVVFDGNILAGGKTGEITAVLTLTGEEVTETKRMTCTNVKNCAEPLMWPHWIPWTIGLSYMTTEWKWLISASVFAWRIECMGLKVTDECESEGAKSIGLLVERMPTFPRLLVEFLFFELEEEKLLSECSLGGKESGGVASVEESGVMESGANELTVS